MVENSPLGIQPQPQQPPHLGIQPPLPQQPQLGIQPQPPNLGVQLQPQLGVQPQPPPPPPAPAPQAYQMPDIDPTQVTRVKARRFVIDVLVDNQVWRYGTQAMNLESLVAQISVATNANMPRISGWNVYDEAGILILSVSALDFIQQLAIATPVGKQPADPKTAGWRAIPVVTPTSQEFQDAISKAKKEGRIPT